MDSILAKLASYEWPYAVQDSSTCAAIAERVAHTGRRRSLLTYSELMDGLTLRLGTVQKGVPFEIGPGEWTELHRTIVGDFLGYLCTQTYPRGGFMGSALVVSKETGQPSEGFGRFMHELGALKTRSDEEFLGFWAQQVQKAYEWYARHDW